MSDSEVIVPSGSGNKHKRTVTLVPKTPLAHQLNGKGTEEKTDDIRIAENLNFNDLMLSEKILKGLSASGFKHPSPIQVEAIPLGRFGLGEFIVNIHFFYSTLFYQSLL